MGPPGVMPKSRPLGGSNLADKSQVERAIRDVHLILANCGIEMSPMRVKRLVRQFNTRVARNGWSFLDFLGNQLQLSAEQHRQLRCNLDLARTISYLDPTGNRAARNVDRKRERERGQR